MGNAKFRCIPPRFYILGENSELLGANPSPHPIKLYGCTPIHPKISTRVITGAGETLGAASPGSGDTVPRMGMVSGPKAPSGPTIAGARRGWGGAGGSVGVSRKMLTPPGKQPQPGPG